MRRAGAWLLTSLSVVCSLALIKGRRRPRIVARFRLGPTFGRGALLALPLVFASEARGAEYLVPKGGDRVIGEARVTFARYEDTLLDIARRHNLGYQEMRLANPGLDVWLPGEGTRVELPTRFILPDARREGIVLNVAELRLYYYPPAAAGEPARVITHPVSIGRAEWRTPLGVTRIVAKMTDPSWYPPDSVRAEHAARGDVLPAHVPPGPDNPLGRHSLRLALPRYLIHGTNRPYGIGMRVTHGCIRMYPEDIAALYEHVPVGTRVEVVNQPIKLGWLGGVLYLESHPPFVEDGAPPPVAQTSSAVRRMVAATSEGSLELVDWERVAKVIAGRRGVPEPVSRSRGRWPAPAP